MDLEEEWEVLPEDGFLEINYDGGKKIFSRRHNTFDDDSSHNNNNRRVFNMNYFICPPSPKHSSHVVPPPPPTDSTLQPDKISQVCFKKMNDPAAADMKMDSPRSSSNKALFVPQAEAAYEVEPFEGTKDNVCVSSPTSVEEGIQEHEGFNFWQWSLTGIGAICSFGVAAATTICIVFIENHQKHKRRQQNHNIRFQIYTDNDKRIKEVVQHATKLNEAISTVRGVPFTRAHITFGGYCDAF